MSDVVARAKAALEGVTEGPWVQVGFGNVQRVPAGDYPPVAKAWRSDNGGFIAAARDLVPELVAEVERLREVLAELVDPDPCRFDHDGDCQAHGFFGITAYTPCAHERAKRLLEVNR